jgi:hypothetical protein
MEAGEAGAAARGLRVDVAYLPGGDFEVKGTLTGLKMFAGQVMGRSVFSYQGETGRRAGRGCWRLSCSGLVQG